MPSTQEKSAQRVPRKRIDKFAERRAELGEAALATLATLGYARTSLREIAQNSEFSHGVLHYYFNDKTDLIVCSVRQYKARCVTRYDRVLAEASSYGGLMAGFLEILGSTLRDEAHMHRLWYDLRAQSLFEQAFRADVAEIDKSLQDMTWRIVSRFSALSGTPASLSPAAAYAVLDGLFQQCLLAHLSGSAGAVAAMQAEVGQVITGLFGQPCPADRADPAAVSAAALPPL
ncbi:TetR/AcrR family transcriptional regulator [Cupriavidus sp. 2TAF22]|uniref:TetR/AcrR family transcriptional regulator n=1 Tax=unclassified Cupriavidus TaxID=2640874 RepID=UPI003F92D127